MATTAPDPIETAAAQYANYRALTEITELSHVAAILTQPVDELKWYGAPAAGLVING